MFILDFFSRIFCRRRKVVGKVKVIKKEYFYVIPNEDIKGDVLVLEKNFNYAIDGDVVEVSYSPNKNKDGRYVGVVTKIIKRGVSRVFGTLDKRKCGYVFSITSFNNYYPINVVGESKIKADIYPCRVEANIVTYPSENSNLECEIVNVYGPIGDDSCELNMILDTYGINKCFPQNVLRETETLSGWRVDEKEINRRVDLRNVFTFTIDPKSSKDFDDAISVLELGNGSYQIGIHIADVSYFVKEGTNLDIEACRRSTSVYFIDTVVPMLPDVLCNNVCSLLPNEDRLTFSVVFEVDKDFNIVSRRICESVIHSNLRLNYDDAQDILDNQAYPYHSELSTVLAFSKKLKEDRVNNGALDFNFFNVDFNVDDDNNFIVEDSNYGDSHVLVEELMILANITVAEYVSKIKGSNGKSPVFIYRVHPKPERWKVTEFCRMLISFHVYLDPNSSNFEKELNKILHDVKGNDLEWVVSTLSMRMMQKAFYSTNPIGHYGLSLSYYSHFTSPIRRYNDIIVHRLLKRYLNSNYEYDSSKYEGRCRYLSDMEKNAVDAERDYIKYKQVKLLKGYEGEKLEGIISAITEWGIFVEILKTRCIGLIRVSSVDNDILLYDRENKYIYGKVTGNIYKIGDKISVLISKCNLELKTVDLSFF